MPRRTPYLPDDIKQVRYEPPAYHRLAVEVLPLSEFKRRVAPEHLLRPQRVEFHLLIYFTAGRRTHMVDFETFDCGPGSLLVLRPGQVQRFDAHSQTWQGWLVLSRPEFLQPGEARVSADEIGAMHRLEEFPSHLNLRPDDAQATGEALRRMFLDLEDKRDMKLLHALLRYQLLALHTRLTLACTRDADQQIVAPLEMQRFRRYRRLVEQEHRRWHRVADYAAVLGCSERTLNRIAQVTVGTTAKQYLTRRIVLEAKRMLVHTTLPVAAIADELGFDEATNFVKYFRREVGQSPGRFRDSFVDA